MTNDIQNYEGQASRDSQFLVNGVSVRTFEKVFGISIDQKSCLRGI